MKKQDDKATLEFLESLSGNELVAGCRQAHDVLVRELPQKGRIYRDAPRWAAVGMGFCGFLETYAKRSAKNGEEIDPTPFHKMIVDDSLDRDFRFALIGMLGDTDFYTPSWRFLKHDLETYQPIVINENLDLETRLSAASNIYSFVTTLYFKLYHQTPALKNIPLDPDCRKREYPDVVLMLKDDAERFSKEETEKLNLLFDAANKNVTDLLNIKKKNDTGRTKVMVYNIVKGYFHTNLLSDPALRTRAQHIVDEF